MALNLVIFLACVISTKGQNNGRGDLTRVPTTPTTTPTSKYPTVVMITKQPCEFSDDGCQNNTDTASPTLPTHSPIPVSDSDNINATVSPTTTIMHTTFKNGRNNSTLTLVPFVATNVPTPQVIPTIENDKDSGPTLEPTIEPTMEPTTDPTIEPTIELTNYPSFIPTTILSMNPSFNPSIEPTNNPSKVPTNNPSHTATNNPTQTSNSPTSQPSTSTTDTNNPSATPTLKPSIFPTNNPSNNPTYNPSIFSILPTLNPSILPSNNPIQISNSPTSQTDIPTNNPSTIPTVSPSIYPTNNPSKLPTHKPSTTPTLNPSIYSTNNPTNDPTNSSSVSPTISASNYPSYSLTKSPTINPTSFAVIPMNSRNPTRRPTRRPSRRPTWRPTRNPTITQLQKKVSSDSDVELKIYVWSFICLVWLTVPMSFGCIIYHKSCADNYKDDKSYDEDSDSSPIGYDHQIELSRLSISVTNQKRKINQNSAFNRQKNNNGKMKNSKAQMQMVISLGEFLLSIVMYIFDSIDCITSLVVSTEYMNAYEACTQGESAVNFPVMGVILAILTIIAFILGTVDMGMYLQEKFCWNEKNDLNTRIINHVKIELALNFVADILMGFVLTISGSMIGLVSSTMLFSIIISVWVLWAFAIKGHVQLKGGFASDCSYKSRTKQAFEETYCDNTVITWYKRLYLLQILLGFGLMISLTGTKVYGAGKVIIIDDVQYDFDGYKKIDLRKFGGCLIECEDKNAGEIDDVYKLDCGGLMFGECNCEGDDVPIGNCGSITCSGSYEFEVCYGECGLP